MSTKVDQKSYLQKYLTGVSGDKKKKKKSIKGKGFKIIDDDIDVTKLRPLEGSELDIYGEGEDAPQIAGIIDERPEDVKKLEQFKTSTKWKVINQDDGFNSKISIEEIKKDIKEQEKENELVFGKMYSDSEDENDKPAASSSNKADTSTQKTKKNSDSDVSPPRKRSNKDSRDKSKKAISKKYDSDSSPPRNDEKRKNQGRPSRKPGNDNASPSRKRTASDSPQHSKKSRKYDSDMSPPRKDENKKTERHSRKHKINSDSDLSPPRKGDKNKKSEKPPMKQHHKSDSDLSPPRKRTNWQSPDTKSKSKNYDSDLSPPRKGDTKKQTDDKPRNRVRKSRWGSHEQEQVSNTRQKSPDSDLSPPRKTKNSQNYDSDASPSRKSHKSSKNESRRDYKRSSNSPPPTNKKMARTLEGKLAGLQDALQLRKENEAFKMRENEVFGKMSDDVSGRLAQVVSRQLGKKRETSEERQKQQEKAARQKELDEKYKKWSRGVKQTEAQEARVQEYMHESAKPLARHRDDRDLEHNLKGIEREGDPMLQYMREKKRERGELAPERPTYKGSFPPNRFNIRPGYRWDGVERSNGYEKKFFEQQSKRRAQEEEYYKWSSADL